MPRSEVPRPVAILIIAVALVGQASATSRATSDMGQLVVAVTGPGRVVSNPAGTISCPPSCISSADVESTVALEAQPQFGDHFVGWGDICTGSAQRCTVAIDESTSVRAFFATGKAPPPPEAIPLNVTRSGDGSVTSQPPGIIDCGTVCGAGYSGGATIQIGATAASGSQFLGWGGSCTGTGPCTIALTAERNVTALFRPDAITPGSSTITISNPQHPDPGLGLAGIGDVRITSPGRVDLCELRSCQYTFANGTQLTLEGIGGKFRSWSGLCVGEFLRCILVVSAGGSTSVRWFGGLPLTMEFGLNVTRAGIGRVVSNPPGIDCGSDKGCEAAYKPDTNVTLTATATSGFAFAEWTGDCSGTAGCRVPMNASRYVAAVFRKKRDSVRITKIGLGSGTVASDPAGVSCGATCEHRFLDGTLLVLRATPDLTSRFGAWGGPCSGMDVCRFNVTAASEVTARFDLCAARLVDTLAASATRHPRRVLVRLQLRGSAAIRVRLRRASKLVVGKTFSNLAPGTHLLRVVVPKAAPRGGYVIKVRIADVCGGNRTLTRNIQVPNP
jgi:hypothetical protein